MPKNNDFEIDGETVDDRLNHRQRLRDHQDAPAIETVGDGAADRAEEKPRHGVEKTHQAE